MKAYEPMHFTHSPADGIRAQPHCPIVLEKLKLLQVAPIAWLHTDTGPVRNLLWHWAVRFRMQTQLFLPAGISAVGLIVDRVQRASNHFTRCTGRVNYGEELVC